VFDLQNKLILRIWFLLIAGQAMKTWPKTFNKTFLFFYGIGYVRKSQVPIVLRTSTDTDKFSHVRGIDDMDRAQNKADHDIMRD